MAETRNLFGRSIFPAANQEVDSTDSGDASSTLVLYATIIDFIVEEFVAAQLKKDEAQLNDEKALFEDELSQLNRNLLNAEFEPIDFSLDLDDDSQFYNGLRRQSAKAAERRRKLEERKRQVEARLQQLAQQLTRINNLKSQQDQITSSIKEKAFQSGSVQESIKVFRRQNTFGSEVKKELQKEGGLENVILFQGGVFMDYIITFFRSFWQVLTNLLANNDNFDIKNNNDSHFNRWIFQKDGDPASGLTWTGLGVFGASLSAPIIGICIYVYQIAHRRWLRSFDYFAEQIRKISPDVYKNKDDQTLLAGLSERLSKAIAKKRLSVQSTALYQPPVAAEEMSFGAKVLRIFKVTISTLWTRLGNYAYIFWLVWMPFVIKFGLQAANAVAPMTGVPFVMPAILLITLLIGTTFIAVDLILKLKQKSTSKTEAQEKAEEESARLEHEAKVLEIVKAEHKQFKKSVLGNEEVKIRQIPKPRINSGIDLKRKLIGSPFKRGLQIATSGVLNFFTGALTVVFIAWFGSSLIGLYDGGAAGTASDIIGGTLFGGAGGAVAGLITSIINMVQMYQQQKAYEAKVDVLIQQAYTANPAFNGETKEQAFQRLYATVEYRKSLFIDKPELKKYLDSVDVFNDRLFEKFEHQAGLWTNAKKIMKRVFTATFGMQSGAFVSRFAFLKVAGVLAGGIGGGIGIFIASGGTALIAFLVVAAIVMTVFGALSLLRYQLNADQEHRVNRLETLDARLYFLETKNKELCALQHKHNVQTQNAGICEIDQPVVAPPAQAVADGRAALALSDYNAPIEAAPVGEAVHLAETVVDADEKPTEALSIASQYTLFAAKEFATKKEITMPAHKAVRSPGALFAPGKKAVEDTLPPQSPAASAA